MSGSTNSPIWTATVHFPGDASVGLAPRGYLLEIPDFRRYQTGSQNEEDKRIREEIREVIRDMYTILDDKLKPTVSFPDEIWADNRRLTGEPYYFADLIVLNTGGQFDPPQCSVEASKFTAFDDRSST